MIICFAVHAPSTQGVELNETPSQAENFAPHFDPLAVVKVKLMNGPDTGCHGCLTNEDGCSELLGASPAFLATLSQLRRIATSEAPLLIEGETGSGKELVARAVHYRGTRRGRPFVPVNCGALPDHLVEAELFGHERGAFTDAKTARRGLVAQANGGTLFLDEVDALSAKAQVTLLRFLQDQHFRPLGSSQEQRTDVRVIAATNQALSGIMQNGHFRCDLLYRLKILHLVLPPLRARTGDAELLARQFLCTLSDKYKLPRKNFDTATLAWIGNYLWPGNVRELENWVHRELLMEDGPTICAAPSASPHEKYTAGKTMSSFQQAKAEVLRAFEHDYAMEVMRQAGGNVTQAARLAGKERRAFGKLVKKHGIDPTNMKVQS
ncbi:sigma-54 dependent transcriptional regulator [Polaromonas sp.]|uniref:sigma 54-interacting transcriptional regulator n=1 Tax=Polaromonas sp. TaxID=1869339 RepID=UPI0025CD7DA2|nr:sigma-54 dependent transcriptional regulator [Polaromonas sp.]